MKNLLRGLTLIASAGAFIINASLVFAGPVKYTVELDSAGILGLATSTNVKTTPTFTLPWGKSLVFAAAITDTNSGAGNGSDSIAVALQKGIGNNETSNWLNPDTGVAWVTVATLNAISTAKGARSMSKIRYLSPDSVSTGPFQVGGSHRFLVFEGTAANTVNTADTMTVPYTIEIILETEGQD